MTSHILASAMALNDQDLLARLEALAATERETAAELVGHLAALELRPSLYLCQGYGSLYEYCTRALHLSEDAACNRTKVVRSCQQFPGILDLLASGALTLTAVRLLAPHLTPENHHAVLARAAHKSRGDIEVMVAELAPRPDVPSSVRRLPVPSSRKEELLLVASETQQVSMPLPSDDPADSLVQEPVAKGRSTGACIADSGRASATGNAGAAGQVCVTGQAGTAGPVRRPVIEALAPGRYRLQFTISQDTHDRLRCVQTLLRREVPGGDPAALFDRALRLLEAEAKAKLGFRKARASARRSMALSRSTAEKRPRGTMPQNEVPVAEQERGSVSGGSMPESPASMPQSTGLTRAPEATGHATYESRIRFETDESLVRHIPSLSRHIPDSVRRAVWDRDEGRCAFVASTGRRCEQGAFLEFHHIQPYAMRGAATVDNISLRCRRHNAYESEVVFGPHKMITEAAELQQRPSEEALTAGSASGEKPLA